MERQNENYQRLILIRQKLQNAKKAPVLKKAAAVEMVVEDCLYLMEMIISDVEALKAQGE